MEYSFKDVLTWTFSHPDAKASIENYFYLYSSQIGDINKSDNPSFLQAIEILNQIAAIGNPRVCYGMFSNAGLLFAKARQTQRNEPKLLSYVGQMLCNHWTGKDYLNPPLQQELSMMEYEGSFWEKHGDGFISLGAAAIAGIGVLCGASPSVAAGCSAKGAGEILDGHSSEYQYHKKHFNNLRNTVLSLRFG